MNTATIKILIAIVLNFFFSTVFAQDADSFYKTGDNKLRAGNYNDAIENFTRVLKIDSNHINALSKRAFCYSLTGSYQEAIADFDKVIKIKPDYLQGYLSRGSAKNKTKQFSQAIVDFNKVLTLDPKNTEALNNRGWAKKGLNDLEGACGDWLESKKLGNSEAKIILKNNNCK